MSIPSIEPAGFVPFVAPTAAPTPTVAPSGGAGFGDLVLDNLDRLESLQDRSDQLAVSAATGDLDDIHDYTIAATEASGATPMTVAVRNKAIEALTENKRMPIG